MTSLKSDTADLAGGSTYSEWHVLFITALTSVATIIGSGILALPVTIYQTTLPVFISIFSVSLVAQMATVYVTIELIQMSRTYTSSSTTSSAAPPSNVQTLYQSTSTSSESSVSSPTNKPTGASSSASASPVKETGHSPVDIEAGNSDEKDDPLYEVSLFTISKLYLPNIFLRFIFHLFSFFSFIAILVSYGLAGPQAIWQLVSYPSAGASTTSSTAAATSIDLQPPSAMFFSFVAIGIICVIFFMNNLLPFFSSLTIVKGALFIIVVFLVVYLPASTKISSLYIMLFEEHQDFAKSYSSLVVSFLMTTIALGGLPLTIPVTYRLLPKFPTAKQISNYRNAVSTGLVLCYLLNIGWVIAILQVVPRFSSADSVTSLQYAFENGQITTIPLIETLRSKSFISSRLLYSVEIIVQLFIIISTVVSFFVMSAGCKTYMDGFSQAAVHEVNCLSTTTTFRNNSLIKYFKANPSFVYGLAYMLAFGPIIALVMSNPKGFITILTRGTGTSINIQAGLMLFIMLYFCRLAKPTGRKARLDSVTTVSNSNTNASGIEQSEPSTQGANEPLKLENKETLADSSNNVDPSKHSSSEIPLSLPPKVLPTLVVVGSLFFSCASFLAAFGPLFGIDLNATE